MNSIKDRLQLAAVIFLLGIVVFVMWYLMIFLPGQMKEPDGTFVKTTSERLVNL